MQLDRNLFSAALEGLMLELFLAEYSLSERSDLGLVVPSEMRERAQLKLFWVLKPCWEFLDCLCCVELDRIYRF